MKKEKDRIILCEGTKCPLAEKCDKYCPTMDKTKTVHWGIIPYNHQKGKCSYFKESDIDLPFVLPPTN
jgi:hypothetical protein